MRLLLLTSLFLLATSSSVASAQTLPTGEWTGELAWSNAEPVTITANIETCAEGLKIRLVSNDELYQTNTTIIAQSGPVEFAIHNNQRGYMLACVLNRQDDGSLSGSCATGSSRARMTLTPPDRSTIGCSDG